MKFGITRWKTVPSYKGLLCMVTPLDGFFQSLVPVARPMKLSTVIGAVAGNSVQVMFPMVVSKMACTGCWVAGVDAAAGFVAGFAAVLPVCAMAAPDRVRMRIAGRKLRIVPPSWSTLLRMPAPGGSAGLQSSEKGRHFRWL